MEKITWEEFRDSGALWFVNRILHFMGLSIVIAWDDTKVVDVYVARTKYRGFDEQTDVIGFINFYEYMEKNMEELKKDVEDAN